jgi:type I restriction enzyme, S subunit
MGLKRGSIHAEVNMPPDDWDLKTIGEIASVSAGGTPSRTNPRYWSGDVPWATTTEVDFGVITHTAQTITRVGLRNSAAKLLPIGTLLMALYGQGKTRGKVAILGIEAATNQACAAISLRANVSPEFLFYSLAGRYEFIRSLSNTGNQENLNGQIVKSIPVAMPRTRAEQNAIVTTLSDVDGLLEGLDRLIAKKRDIKQAAMQQLLTGQMRLKGFNGEWERKRLGDVGVFLKGSGVRKDEAQSGDLPCIRYGEIYTHHNDYVRRYNSWITPAVAATAVRLRKGDLLFAGSGETKEEIGKCVAFVDDCEAYAGGDVVILRPHEADPIFMGYYCNTASIRQQKASKGQGDAVVHIGASSLGSIEVVLPAPPEQHAIATVLSDMDEEIEALKLRRAKTADLKQAMMHELLTGKTRLVTPEVVHA